ncbi:hypothetical protein [Limnobacter sp.]|uniref:hypothetical protein n=1 Tax=Limnobacter sp. TaxID=2003368 RepID=UPI0027BA43A1|nr:hypothetical protein [Limnobacter sp.]
MLANHNSLATLLGLEPLGAERSQKFATLALAYLANDGIDVEGDDDSSISAALPIKISLSDLIPLHGDRRGSNPKHFFAETLGGTGYENLRNLLFTANQNQFIQKAFEISQLRLFLLERAFTARELGTLGDKNIELISKVLISALTGRGKLNGTIVERYTRLDNSLDIKSKIQLWALLLSQAIKTEIPSDKKSIKAVAQALTDLANHHFQGISAKGIASVEFIEIKLSQFDESSPWNDERQTNGDGVFVQNKKNATRENGSARANLGRAFRISQNLLRVDHHHNHFWPAEAKTKFETYLNDLKNRFTARSQLKALVLETVMITGLPGAEVIQLPVTANDSESSFKDWHFRSEKGKLELCRARPKRINSRALPQELKKYCFELGEYLRIDIKGFQSNLHQLLFKRCESGPIALQDLQHNWSEIIKGPENLAEKEKSLEKQLFDELFDSSFFNLKSLRYQSYGLLNSQFNNAAIAELALARPDQSTSAMTAYAALIKDSINTCGSEIAFTITGITSFTKTISNRFNEAAKNLETKKYHWTDLANLASKRIWMSELIFLGRRPVSTGIQDRAELDIKNQLAYIQDKHVKGYEEGRIAYVPNKFKDELQNFFRFLQKLQAIEYLPLEVKNYLEACSKNSRVTNAPITALFLRDTNSSHVIKVREVNPKLTFQEFAHEAADVQNCFRHHWIQQLHAASQADELTMAFAGHSDSLRMVYGPTSNRCRKNDLNEIAKHAEEIASNLCIDTNNFWSAIDNLIVKLRLDLEGETRNSVEFPKLWGRELRKANREQESNRVYDKLISKIKATEESLEELQTSETSEPEQEFQINQLRLNFKQNFLKELTRSEIALGNKRINQALKEVGWDLVLDTYEIKQLFPSANLFIHNRTRDSFESWLRTNRNTIKEQTYDFCCVVELIYRYNLLNPKDLQKLFDQNWTRIVENEKEHRYLEIARRHQFSNETRHQCYRIKLASWMNDCNFCTLLKSFNINEIDDDLVQIFGLTENQNPTEVFLRIQAEALDIALFEQPAYLANNFKNSPPTSSTNWTSIFILNDKCDSKIADKKQAARPIKTLNRSSQSDQSPLLKRLKKDIYAALNHADWKVTKVQLEKIKSDEFFVYAMGNYAEILQWAINSIDQNQSKKLKASTVARYLGAVFIFTEIVGEILFEELETDEIEIMVEVFEESIIAREDRQIFVSGLNSYIDYLAENVNEEFDDIYLACHEVRDKSVRAEWISETEYVNLLYTLQLEFESNSNQVIAFISAMYRFGERLNEAKFSLFDDVYSISNQLVGIRVKKNRFRNIKSRKPPRNVFVNPQDPLNELEKFAWRELISERKLMNGKEQLGLFLFDESFRTTKFLLELLEIIRRTTGNQKLTFHAFRHSFANRRALRCFESPRSVATQNEVPSQIKQSCSALDLIRLGLGHSKIETSWVSYIHVVDQVTEHQTRGIRRGSSKRYSGQHDWIFELPTPAALRKSGRPKTIETYNQSSKSFDDFYQFRLFLETGKISLTQSEFQIFSALIQGPLQFHHSAPIITTYHKDRSIKINFSSRTSKNLLTPKSFEKILKDLKSVWGGMKDVDRKDASFLQHIISSGGEVLISTATDFSWIRILGLGPMLISFEKPKATGGSVFNFNYSELFGIGEEEFRKYKLEESEKNLASEVTHAKLTKGMCRLRLKWINENNGPSETYAFFILAVVLWVKKTSSRGLESLPIQLR